MAMTRARLPPLPRSSARFHRRTAMSIKAKTIRKTILKPAKKLGIVLVKGGRADEAVTRGSKLAADVLRRGEKQVRKARATAASAYEELRAQIDDATAPRQPRK
jgi:hypothetical protein